MGSGRKRVGWGWIRVNGRENSGVRKEKSGVKKVKNGVRKDQS